MLELIPSASGQEAGSKMKKAPVHISADIQKQTTIYTQVHACGQFRGALSSIQYIVVGGSWCAQDNPMKA